MWRIGDVKEKGKWAFKRNYWKAVVVGLLLTLIAGGLSYGGNYTERFSNNYNQNSSLIGEKDEEALEEALGIEESDTVDKGVAVATGIAILVCVVIVLVVVAVVIGLAVVLDIYVFNPIEIGAKSFFVKNINTDANVKEVLSVFDDKDNYKSIVTTMFLRDLYTFLWFLLFIIPGFVKGYEYRMIPYLLADYPQMTREEAFAESKRLMKGNKWHAFVLDLSFIGWHLLSICTLGILSIFYVTPYKMSADAVLYETLKYGNGNIVYTQIED